MKDVFIQQQLQSARRADQEPDKTLTSRVQ
jgi:hypothetical protein